MFFTSTGRRFVSATCTAMSRTWATEPSILFGGSSRYLAGRPSSHIRKQRVHHNWYAVCCRAPRSHRSAQHRLMTRVKQYRPEPASDPVPCTCSDENINKAQAIREALRRKLLDQSPPQSGPYQVIGTD